MQHLDNKVFSHVVRPDVVTEVEGIPTEGGIVELRDGSLLLVQNRASRLSRDGGKSWSAESAMDIAFNIAGMIRLQSGHLAVYGHEDGKFYSALSADDGNTWSDPSLITGYPNFWFLHHAMIQLRSGRLLATGYWAGMNSWDEGPGTMVSIHPDLQYDDVMSYGIWRGKPIGLEGHGHAPEMGMTVIFRSDDEGKTWEKHPGALMGWFDAEGNVNGNAGQTSCFEPTIAEAKDGSVTVMMRSTVGRLVHGISNDGGEQWCAVKPTELPSSESPALMITLPDTGDLLIFWNQVSREEIRRGFRRGRLSSAISKDGGHSWGHFKTLERCEGLEDIARVPPETPLLMVRARDRVGPLPDGWAYYHYVNADIIGDKILLRYGKGSPLLGIAEQNLQKQQHVLRIYPINWFYE